MSAGGGFLRRQALLERLEFEGPADRLGRLEAAQARAAAGLRRRIRGGRAGRERLRRAFERLAAPEGSRGYDALDALVARLLPADAPGAETLPPDPERVPYQPTPARAVLALIRRAGLGPGERAVDLGSGLGQPAILLALLSGAGVTGLEIEPAFHAHAVRSAAALGVAGAEFRLGDICAGPLPDADLYYLYTPVRGSLQRRLLDALRGRAGAAFRVCGYGPCVRALAEEPWLRRRGGGPLSGHRVEVFDAAPAR